MRGWSERTGPCDYSIRIMDWQVYIILCSDATLYTGITNDLDRRLSRHAAQQGARYFRGRKPLRVVYLESGHTRSSASKREAAIKQLSRRGKWRLLVSEHNEIPAPGFYA
jgi:putative endonuclease